MRIYKTARAERRLAGRLCPPFSGNHLRRAHGADARRRRGPSALSMRDFGNAKGGAGFVLYRVTGGRIALWVAAVPGGDVAWARPLVGAVALSMRCASPGAPKEVPRDPALLATRISHPLHPGPVRRDRFRRHLSDGAAAAAMSTT